MAISGYCEEKNLHSIFGYKVKPVSVAIKGKQQFINFAQNKTTSFFRIDHIKKSLCTAEFTK